MVLTTNDHEDLTNIVKESMALWTQGLIMETMMSQINGLEQRVYKLKARNALLEVRNREMEARNYYYVDKYVPPPTLVDNSFDGEDLTQRRFPPTS